MESMNEEKSEINYKRKKATWLGIREVQKKKKMEKKGKSYKTKEIGKWGLEKIHSLNLLLGLYQNLVQDRKSFKLCKWGITNMEQLF